jgi:alpha-ketoglutarate-dependent taurine dioxygenase
MTDSRTYKWLPEGWLSDLRTAGYHACNFAERVGGLDSVTDAVLLAIAGRLAALAPGLSCSAIMHIQEEPGSPYAALTSCRLPFHNDHLYFYKPPNYLLFYCDDPGEEGGDTLVVRGDEACRRLNPHLREELERVRIRVRRGDCCIARTLVTTHPLDGSKVLLFSDSSTDAQCKLELGGKLLDAAIIGEVRAVLASLEAHRQRWRAGDLLVLDNIKVLHAREAFRGRRVLRRIAVGPHAARG